MKKFKIITFSLFCVAIVSLFAIEIFAAVYLSIRVSGNIQYRATEIGANIWGTKQWNENGSAGTPNYLTFSGTGKFENDIYSVRGEENSYSNITATVGTTVFSSANDSVEFYLFIKNTGDRYIVPNVSVSASQQDFVTTETSLYYFDISLGHTDLLASKKSSSSATEFLNIVKSEITANKFSTFSVNSSMDNKDIFLAKVVIKLTEAAVENGSVQVNSTFNINIGFMADVQYDSNDILSVFQEQNQSTVSWTKYGYNSTLAANATKIEENNMQNLELYLKQADANGNANVTVRRDDYHNAIVYKDIDLVNVDIATGELVGWLSDPNYKFEWYGREITLPAGTTLASGRTLVSQETFTVDVYTKYPTMYVRRWVVGNEQWLSISDKSFLGSVKINEYYTATFEATIFNPDKSIATNDYGIITRSYVYDYTPLTEGSVNYLQTYYKFKTVDQNGNPVDATISPTLAQMVEWANNLTLNWQNSGLDASYRKAKGVQGENWTAYVYNILYLVKYASNNSQDMVGYGNSSSNFVYSIGTAGTTTLTGDVLQTVYNNQYAMYEAIKGSGTIGVCNIGRAGTATYDEHFKMSATGYNKAGFNYGYNSEYTFGSDKTGLYANQFLTYNKGTKRVLLDGYVGSQGYTSVMCLGMCNVWGNVRTWLCGNSVLSNGTELFAYTNFDNYDAVSGNYVLTSSAEAFEIKEALLTSKGYSKMSYNLPTENGYYYYLGTSSVVSESGIESLVGLPIKGSSKGNNSTGLCDNYINGGILTDRSFGILRSGSADEVFSIGTFYFCVMRMDATDIKTGFRTALIS